MVVRYLDVSIAVHVSSSTTALSWCRLFRSSSIYYVLCTYVSPITSSLSPVAVYPPLTIEEEEARLREINAEKAESGELDLDEKALDG